MHPPGLERENTFFKERLQPRLVVNTDALFEYPDYAEHARERFEFVQKVRTDIGFTSFVFFFYEHTW